jgi:hypothetical protein
MIRNYIAALFFPLVLMLTSFSASAQGIPVADTVSLGAGYVNQVYYSLVSGQKTAAPVNEWDVAFQANGITFGVWVNRAAGFTAHLVPNLDASDWGTAVDTTGFSTWPALENGTASWANGAFNQNSTNQFDVGWGNYSGPPAHEVNGDSIYLVKYADGTFKQLLIENLNVNRYVFRFADLDGTNEMVDSVLKNDDRNFSYYSLKNAVEIDREPSNGDWDLWFTNGLTANVVVGPPGTPLGTASGAVYINRGIQSIRISGVPNDSADYMTATFDSTIYKIGDTYRIRVSNPPPGGWVVVDSNVYFIKAKDTEIYKLVFTSYEGQGTGKVTFEKTQLTNNATSVNDITSNATRIALYPNPAVDQLNLILDATEAGMHNIIVTDLAGKVAYNTTVAVNGLQNISIPVSNFANGLYLVSVEANGNRSVQKFVKQ